MSHSETIIHIDDCEGAALDWLVARAEQIGVFASASASGTTTCWLRDKPKQQFSPSSRWRQCGPLIDKYDVMFSRCGDQIQAVCPTDATGSFVSAHGPDRMTASCRAIAKSFFGSVGVIPYVLASENTRI